MAIYKTGIYFGIAVSDISTGEFLCSSVASFEKVIDEITKYQPKELLYSKKSEFINDKNIMLTIKEITDNLSITISEVPEYYYNLETIIVN